MLFLRMFVLMLINLYSVRIILRGMGIEAYGIYNSVAGVVTLSACINTIMAMSIQRFYAFALGRHDNNALQDIFSVSMNTLAIASLLILVVFETVGLCFLSTQLSYPPSSATAVQIIYQFGLFSFICSLLQIPYYGAIIAHEDMSIYALISMLEGLLRLGVALTIGIFPIDPLTYYGVGLGAVSLAILLLYSSIGHARYPECRHAKVSDHGLYRKILSFSGWTFFGSMASTAIMQGSTILLNIFWGPITTAAFAIATQINNAVQALSNSITTAFRPPMIKSYAENDFQQVGTLFYMSNKMTYYILLSVSIPLITEMEGILHFWLGDTGGETVVFAQFIIVYVMVITMNGPITTIIHATGNLKGYHLPVESITLSFLPIAWLLLHAGFPAYSLIIVMIVVSSLAHVIRLFCLRRFYPSFSIYEYIVRLVVPALFISAACGSVAWYETMHIAPSVSRALLSFTMLPMLTVGMTYAFGVNKQERRAFNHIVNKFISRVACHR